MLTREAILAAQDLRTQTVEVPEWGGAVTIKTMTGRERDRFMDLVGASDNPADANQRMGTLVRRLIVTTVVDEAGQRLFQDEDADALGEKSPEVLQRIFLVAQELNGLGPKAQESIAKN